MKSEQQRGTFEEVSNRMWNIPGTWPLRRTWDPSSPTTPSRGWPRIASARPAPPDQAAAVTYCWMSTLSIWSADMKRSANRW
jgi:hypothetical protein